MNATENLPVWECNSPPCSSDSFGDLDFLMGRFSSPDKGPLHGDSRVRSQIPLDNGMPASRSWSSVTDCDKLRRNKFDYACRLNNNVSDSGECGIEKCNAECARQGVTATKRPSGAVSGESSDGECEREMGRIKRRMSLRERRNGRVVAENVACEMTGECVAGAVGGGGGDDGDDDDDEERSPRRQRELTSSDEINKRDVITSRGITSNPSEGSKRRVDDVRSGACGEAAGNGKGSCSAGSYSRRKHHKHHKHKRRSQSPTGSEEPISPRVNPIFLWVRQDDTRIVEVMCEDYDHRNRIRLTRTHLGWRAIPKTERFAAAIIPKAPLAKNPETDAKRRHRKKGGKKRKAKKRRVPVQSKESLDCAEDGSETMGSALDGSRKEDSDAEGKTRSRSNSESGSGESPDRSLSEKYPELRSLEEEPTLRLTKSFSCDFTLLSKRTDALVRSQSLDFATDEENRLELERNFRVQNKSGDDAEEEESEKEGDGPEPEVNRPDVKSEAGDATKEDAKSTEEEENTGVPAQVLGITKPDPDSNDAECDELGQLLKDIPDLEFPEEAEEEEGVGLKGVEKEEVDEWSLPTDLTVPKVRTEEEEEEERPRAKLPVLPANISSLVTVLSAPRPPEPLTAPLPEVTITPIPNPKPKPAHQQKPQNKFLESLLSTPYPVKPEKDEVTITRFAGDRRPADKRKLPHAEPDPRSKKVVLEDITLKSLLSKQHPDKSAKGLELENHVRKMRSKQESENQDMSKSRLHELLTEGPSSGSADPIAQLKQVLSNPDLAVPDPLLVPRARLPALVASPASEIPRLLTMYLEKKVEMPSPPLTDSDILEVSLSNLRSLLSCKPDKIKSTDSDDLTSYQKSLEAFLEWQRYQTELMEAHMKNSSLKPGLSPTDIDLATATALNQMLWLPYLELNGNAMASPMASVFGHNYPLGGAIPHIGPGHFAQSSPFLTPTSPMDIDAQMKTLAMWQETLMAQQNNHSSRKMPGTLLSSAQHEARAPKVPGASQRKQRPDQLPSPQQPKNLSRFSPKPDPHRAHFGFDPHRQSQFKQHQEQFLRQQYEMHRKQPKQRHAERHRAQSQHHDSSEPSECEKKSRVSISVKPLSNLVDKSSRQGKKQSWHQLEQDLRTRAEATNETALRWQALEEEMRRNRARWNRSKVKYENPADRDRDRQADPGRPSETAKLKVKNLVDPNMSPPKLLKQMAPEEVDEPAAIQDESQAHLWHPLFGSNQIKSQQYNSPWRWTTVTVNGE